MTFLLAHWKTILAGIGGFVLATWIANFRIEWLKLDHEQELNKQTRYNIEQCDKSKQATEDSNEHYQNIIARRDGLIAELSKRPEKCVCISKPASATQASGAQPTERAGLPDSVLYRFGSLCEADRAGFETLYRHLEKLQCKLKE